jgi:protein O-mannosyl-transferase
VKIAVAIFFLLVAFSLYANSLRNDFIFDDNAMLVRNLYIRDLRFIPKLFTTGVFHFYSSKPFPDDYYRPFQTLSYAFEYPFWKLNPAGYRATSIAIHALNSFLVFLFISLLFKERLLALLASALFCVHPIQVSMVGFISSRAHLLGAAFILSSLIAYLKYNALGRRSLYALSLLAYACALLAWEGALLLPLLLLSCMCILRLDKKKIFPLLLPYAAFTVVYLWLRARYMPTDRFTLHALGSAQAMKDFIWSVQLYATQLLLPFGVRTMLFGQAFFLKLVFFCASFAVMAFFLVRAIVVKDKAAVTGLSFYLIGLFPVINLTSTLREFGYILSEHYAYVASIGFFLFCASCVMRSRSRFNAAANLALACIFAGYPALTVMNNANYKDNITFYKHIVSVNPEHLFIRANLGNAYLRKGMYDKATEQAKIMLAAVPDSWNANFLLGQVSMAKGDAAKAIELYKRAFALNPRSSDILDSLGAAFQAQGRRDDAAEAYNKAIKLNPEDTRALVMSGIILAQSNRFGEAEKAFQGVLRVEPGSVEARQNLAALYANAGNYDAAIFVWEEILAIDSGNKPAKESIERARRIKEGPVK